MNHYVEATLNILEHIEGVPKLRIKQLQSYIESLEKENAELGCFFDKVTAVVRDYIETDDPE